MSHRLLEVCCTFYIFHHISPSPFKVPYHDVLRCQGYTVPGVDRQDSILDPQTLNRELFFSSLSLLENVATLYVRRVTHPNKSIMQLHSLSCQVWSLVCSILQQVSKLNNIELHRYMHHSQKTVLLSGAYSKCIS